MTGVQTCALPISQKAAAAEPRAAALEARVGELEKALQAATAPDPRVAELGGQLSAAGARVAELESRLAELAPPPEAPSPAAEAGGCKVAGCPEPVRSKGFCSAHYQQWRRGTLKGFVTAEATALIDGKLVHLPKETAGAVLTVQNGKIYADGRLVKAG